MSEEGADQVHLVFRHKLPQFGKSDPVEIQDVMFPTIASPGAFLRLSSEEKARIWQRTIDGRERVSDWLEPRIRKPCVRLWPLTQVKQWRELSSGELAITLDKGDTLEVDYVVFGTGYREDVARLPFLSKETLLPLIAQAEGFPVMDDYLQSTVPGLYFAGMAAKRDHGPTYNAVMGGKAAGRFIVEHVARKS